MKMMMMTIKMWIRDWGWDTDGYNDDEDEDDDM